ncbi:unnamed protein product [Chondrus crispus]|uniref:Uncharacterized protein n=1 Tax=Chondrus crispus TaxID=2769 RepID=R7Q5I4_CHOCR|nr:unnamed protein product [Chondrus crispus]CDF32631.1 unnamed protein product [Chondrus crispus]|eukprot:XP_005712402.1 unnamed protein product [Chondrus crispus]
MILLEAIRYLNFAKTADSFESKVQLYAVFESFWGRRRQPFVGSNRFMRIKGCVVSQEGRSSGSRLHSEEIYCPYGSLGALPILCLSSLNPFSCDISD